LSITKLHKPQIHRELTNILSRYSSNPNAASDNIMNDILECVRKDDMLAQIFKKFLSFVSPVYLRIQRRRVKNSQKLWKSLYLPPNSLRLWTMEALSQKHLTLILRIRSF